MAAIKKYNGSTFVDAAIRKYSTASEIITPPTTIYCDGSNITTYSIKGNTVQNGTPTPSNPVPVVGVGELETTGEHSGEYKIPISTLQTVNNYLGSIQSTRQIYKHELTGQETWSRTSTGKMYSSNALNGIPNYKHVMDITTICSHFKSVANAGNTGSLNVNEMCLFGNPNAETTREIYIYPENYATAADFQTYLQQQYANGTPVTVYYVLATATTGIVNEPLQKIGDYADSISNATAIPTTDGANALSVGTTLKPSEVSANYHGWHPVSAAHEKSRNLFDKDNTTIYSAYIGNDGKWITISDGSKSIKIPVDSNTQYTLSIASPNSVFRIYETSNSNPEPSASGLLLSEIVRSTNINQYTFTTTSDTKYIVFQASGATIDSWFNSLMLNTGSTPQPYEPYWN